MAQVIVVGGGLAGSALSIMLGRAGLSVDVYERSSFPREKPCGEGLMPAGVTILRRLGLEHTVGGEPLFGVRYHVRDTCVHAPLAGERDACDHHGLGQRRYHLDAALWRTAHATLGVRVFDGARVTGPLVEHGRVTGVVVDGQSRRAELVVAADGCSSTLRRSLGLERRHPGRVGIRAHFKRASGQPKLSQLEIFMRAGYELYVTPLPNDEVLVAALAHRDVIGGSLRASFTNWIAAEPLLMRWLEGAVQISELLGRSSLVRDTNACVVPGLVLIGDAAGSVDPITASGMSLALASAELLAMNVRGLLSYDPAVLRSFELARSRMVRTHRRLAGCLLALAARPALASLALVFMRMFPAVMRSLVNVAATTGSTACRS